MCTLHVYIHTFTFPRLYITVAGARGYAKSRRRVDGSLIDLHVPVIQTIDEAERETDFDTNETSVLRANAHCCVYNVTHVGVFLGYSCHSV